MPFSAVKRVRRKHERLSTFRVMEEPGKRENLAVSSNLVEVERLMSSAYSASTTFCWPLNPVYFLYFANPDLLPPIWRPRIAQEYRAHF